MKNICTHETSLRLKAAGFPQPEPEAGQFWYGETVYKGGTLEHTPLCVVVEKYSSQKLFLRRLDCEHYVSSDGGNPKVFAPTAADILRELSVEKTLSLSAMAVLIMATNPEDAAKAWLELKK